MIRVLMVCTANVCRSPMAAAVAQDIAERRGLATDLQFASAGVHASRLMWSPDPRARGLLEARAIPFARRRARPVVDQDFHAFDLILAMDGQNLRELRLICPGTLQGKLALFMAFAAHAETVDVPDPYYGSAAGFENVLDLCESGASALVQHLVDVRATCDLAATAPPH